MKSTAIALVLALTSLSAQEKPTEEVKRPEGGEAKKEEPAAQPEHKEHKPNPKRGPEMKAAPFLGVVTRPPSPEARAMSGVADGFGLLVEDLMPESPAKTAGLLKYDLITQFNDQRLVNQDQLAALVVAAGKDAEVSLTLVRKGAEQKVSVKLAERMVPVVQHHEFNITKSFSQVFNKEDMQRMGAEMREKMQRYGGQMREWGEQWGDKFNERMDQRRPQPPMNQQERRHEEGHRPEGKPHGRDGDRRPEGKPQRDDEA
jgi:hypothetical protein